MDDDAVVNPNYGGDEESTPENDPLVNPNYGGERAHEAEDIDNTVDPKVNRNYGGEDRPRPPKEHH